MRRCENCGMLIDDKTVFCGNCGNVIQPDKEHSDSIDYNHDIDNYLSQEFQKKKNLSKPCVMLATFLMLAAVMGIVIVFKIMNCNDYRKPIEDFFDALNDHNYTELSQTIYPGIDEGFDLTEQLKKEFETNTDPDELEAHFSYTIEDTHKFDQSGLIIFNSDYAGYLDYEIEKAYSLEIDIKITYTGTSAEDADTKELTRNIYVGCYDKEWYIFFMEEEMGI